MILGALLACTRLILHDCIVVVHCCCQAYIRLKKKKRGNAEELHACRLQENFLFPPQSCLLHFFFISLLCVNVLNLWRKTKSGRNFKKLSEQ